VICRSIKPGRQNDYDDWLERYKTSQKKVPAYIGTTIIIPGGSKSS
jgi:antibiotic biosynthesis monooxygenase (ABM) superfamily enzyme